MISARPTLLLAALTLLAATASAQHQWCHSPGTLSPALVARAMACDAQRGGGTGVRTLKLKVLIAADPGAPGGPALAVPPSRVQADLDLANGIFERCNTGIRFQLCGPMQVIEDAQFYFGTPSTPAVLAAKESGYITAMYVLTTGGQFTGAAFGLDMVVAAGASSNTLAHELGHVLGLYHTFDTSNGAELVDGSNCSTAGDLICDTPAAPQLNLPGLLAPGCIYVGTVTDANGDPYTPQANNLMGYGEAFCNTDSLTPGQGALMRFVADSVLLQLRRTDAPITIDPFDLRQCPNSGPLALSATPAPGVFSGPLVNGTTLTNFPAPPGEYAVDYTPATPPEGPATVIDQSHGLNSAFLITYANYAADSVWQRFRPEMDGTFQRFDILTAATATQTARLRIYAGTAVQGTPLLDITAPMPADTAWTSFLLPPGTASTDGDTYTALLTAPAPFGLPVPSNWPYLRGESSLNGQGNGPDLAFRHWVSTTPECQGTARYYSLYQVPDRPVINLPDAYCHSDARTVQLAVDPTSLTASQLLLDGAPLTPFVPASLSTGAHLAQHIYTLNGCTDTLDQAFVVEPPPTFTFPGLPAPVCTVTDPFVLQGAPAGGHFRINGERDSLFVPQALGVGTQVIDYIYSTLLDTVTFVDQQCTSGPLPAYAFPPADSVVWQSFTVQQGGTLDDIELFLFWPDADPRTFALSLHAGTGVGGPLLWSAVRSAFPLAPGLFANSGVELIVGSTCTFAFSCLTPNGPLPQALHYNGDAYGPGEARLPGITAAADLYFAERITQRFPCADSTSFAIDVEVCTGLAGGLPPGVSVAPNPFAGVLLLGTAAEAVRYELLLSDGRCVRTGSAAPHTRHTIDAEGLSAGCYLLRLGGAEGGWRAVLRVVRE